MSKKRPPSSSPSASPRTNSFLRPFSPSSSSLLRWEAVELGHGGLWLIPRLRVLLSFVRADLSVRPLDEWQLRQYLLDFLRDSLSIIVSDKDLSLHKHKNPHKRRSDEALASGVLYIWDIQALLGESSSHKEDADIILQERERMLIEKLTGVELNLGGLKLRCYARPEDRDDFSLLKRSWHEANKGPETGLPDTMVLRGIPSRWLAELRVSSKASVLVTHTIFSQFGAVRNLDIQVNDSESLSCNVWVQFERYSEFHHAMAAFCGRSMEKEGSNFKANYEVNWDNDGYFTEGNIRKRKFEKERLEDLRRRQAFIEARQADITRRQADLAKFEQERKEAERIQQLREEENLRREREAAAAEQEVLRQKELERVKEEEKLQKEKALREKVQREEEQKALEVKRHEEELRKLEEQVKEKQRANVCERETRTDRSPRYGSPKRMNRSHLDSRRQPGKTGREEERWAQRNTHGSGNGYHDNNFGREHNLSNSSSRGCSVPQLPPADVITEDFRDDDLQRWVLDTGPSLLTNYMGFKVGSKLASGAKRLKSVIVDSRQIL